MYGKRRIFEKVEKTRISGRYAASQSDAGTFFFFHSGSSAYYFVKE
jgi:hypothetical protein